MANRYQTKIIRVDEKGKVHTVFMTRPSLEPISPDTSDRLCRAFSEPCFQISSYATEMGWPFRPLQDIPCDTTTCSCLPHCH